MSHVYYNYNQFGIGYKAFSVISYSNDGDKLDNPYTAIQLDWGGEYVKIRENIWYTAKVNSKKRKLYSNLSDSHPLQKYPAGFHIFGKKEDAISYGGSDEVVYKVKFKDLVSVGENATYNSPEFGLCFIARKIMLLEKVSINGEKSIL